MSRATRTLLVYVPAQHMPDLAALQAVVSRLKFKLTVDEAYAPFETQGYLPCTLDGEDAGVDMRFERDATCTVADALPTEPDWASGKVGLMQLKWSGDPREHLSAVMLAVAMADGFAARVIDPDKACVVTAEALLKKARSIQEELF